MSERGGRRERERVTSRIGKKKKQQKNQASETRRVDWLLILTQPIKIFLVMNEWTI